MTSFDLRAGARAAIDRGTRMEAITVLAADRQPLFREAVMRAVRQRPALRLVGDAEDGWAALEIIRLERPTVAVIACDLDRIDGLRVLNAVVRDELPTRVLLVGSAAEQAGYHAIAAGASGWLSHFSRADEVCEAIIAAAHGQMVLRHEVQSAIAERIRERSRHGTDVLSPRERELVRLLADGRSPTQAGRELHLSAGTVKSTLLRLYKRLGVADRAALVAVGLRRGWID
jgi:two-component system nitrate/nitrite response regulator NarL